MSIIIILIVYFAYNVNDNTEINTLMLLTLKLSNLLFTKVTVSLYGTMLHYKQ